MLLCIPAVKELYVSVYWSHSERVYKTKLKNPEHARVKDLVKHLRSTLEHAADHFKEDAHRVALDFK
jgi:hypothetical protein